MLESGDFIWVDSCPACGNEATVDHVAGHGYTCSCSNPKCHMSMAGSYMPTAFATIHNWNGLTLAIDMSRAKGGVDESDMARIFGPIPDESKEEPCTGMKLGVNDCAGEK